MLENPYVCAVKISGLCNIRNGRRFNCVKGHHTHTVLPAVKTEGKTVRVWGPLEKYDNLRANFGNDHGSV